MSALDPMLDRRTLLAGGLAGAAFLGAGAAQARPRPQDIKPLIGPGFRPTDEDEKGLWKVMERVEEEVSSSALVVKDPALNTYLRDIMRRVGGPAAKDFRLYLLRIPDFNAMMFPTGMGVIFTGLLTRMRNEAQLAGVIGHEAAHFLRRHHIRSWRDMKRKSDAFAVLGMAAGIAGAGAGVNLGDAYRLAEFGTLVSLLKFSRTMEEESDALGMKLIADQGYDPREMSETWRQLIGEQRLADRYRQRIYRRDFSIFSTHPIPETRMADLAISAREVMVPGRRYDKYRERYLENIRGIRPDLLDDMVKLNNPGSSQYVVNMLAEDGWNGLLRYNEAEIWRLRNRQGDDIRAAQGYAAAVVYPDAPADAWRWHGIMLRKAGKTAESRAAFSRYLQLAPNAPDAALVRQMMSA